LHFRGGSDSPSLWYNMSAIVGPVAPYSNPPINPQYYKPSRFVISDISIGLTTLVTTSIKHNYSIGSEIRLLIPPGYGCRQLNERKGYVVEIPSDTQIVLDINSQFIDPFVAASLSQSPQTLAVGDINSGIISHSGRVNPVTNIPGSFINISPQ